MDVREILEAVEAGELSVSAAEAELRGYTTGEAGRFDAARTDRRGIMEAIFAPGKTPTEVTDLATAAVDSTGRALVTRTDQAQRDALTDRFGPGGRSITVDVYERSGSVVVTADTFERPTVEARVGIVSGGTADSGPVEEAAVVLRELGIAVDRIEDVGVANLTRVVDELPAIRSVDVLIVAAGREGALPTVVAGLVDVPVIGLPISSGYGRGGQGRAAILGMLQSCTVLTTVNVDAGFVAGGQAGLIARAIAVARGTPEGDL